MSNNMLDKTHPFRSNVDLGAGEPVNTATPIDNDKSASSLARQALDNKPKPEKQSRDEEKQAIAYSMFLAFLKLSPKKRLLTIAVFGGSICYGYMTLYDALFGSPGPAKSSPVVFRSATDEFDPDVEISKPSWIQRTFCTGVKRKFLCD